MEKMKTNTLKKSGLGRGLGAILDYDNDVLQKTPDIIAELKKEREREKESPAAINEISLDLIETNPFQPRNYFNEEALIELADSIKVQGIIQPITVRKLEEGRYQIISGERRFRASKIAGLKSIPAYIRTANDQQILEMALIENIQRENLNSIEVALSYQRLMHECNLKQEELGERVGKNRTTVNNYIRLLKLPPTIQAALQTAKISMGHARAIISVENSEVQLFIYKKVVEEDWSVRKVEEAVRNIDQLELNPAAPKRITPPKKELVTLQGRLASYFGSKVTIKADDSNKGEIRIPFVSQEDLDRILQSLKME